LRRLIRLPEQVVAEPGIRLESDRFEQDCGRARIIACDIIRRSKPQAHSPRLRKLVYSSFKGRYRRLNAVILQKCIRVIKPESFVNGLQLGGFLVSADCLSEPVSLFLDRA